MTGRFEVFPVPSGSSWWMVADLSKNRPDATAAMFAPDYREEAQEFADRLNVRELAGRSG